MADESKDDTSYASSGSASPLKRGRRPPKPTKDKGRPKPAKREKPKFNPKGGRKAPAKKPMPPVPETKAAPPIPPKKPQLTVRVVGPDMRPSSGGSYDSRPGSSDSFRPSSAGTYDSRPSSGGSDYSERSMTPEEDDQNDDAGGFFDSHASTASDTLEEIPFEERPMSPTYYDDDSYDYDDDRPESPYSDDGDYDDEDLWHRRSFGFRPMTPVAEGSESGWSSPASSRPNTGSPYRSRGSLGSPSGSDASPLEEPFFHQESVQTSLPPEDTSLQTTSLAEELGGEGEVLLHDGDTFPGASPLDDSSLAFSIASPEPEAEAPAPAPNEESSWESYTNTTPTLKEDSLTTVDESGSLERKSLDTVSVLTEPKEETKEQILDGEESDETATPRDDPNADEPKVSERIEKEAQEKAKEAETAAIKAQDALRYEQEKRELVEVEICILSARDLRGADIGVFSSKSDPYVKGHTLSSKTTPELIGKTSWKSQTLNPRWSGKDDVLRVTFDLMSDAFQGVRLGVWDYDVGGDDALGMVTLSREELLEPRLQPLEKALVPHPDSPAEKRALTTGHLTVRIHVAGVVAIFVDCAKHLLAADGALGGASDPYAVAKWVGHNSRKLSQTRTISDSLSPDWNHAFLVPIPLIRPVHGGCVQVSVWDDDYFGSDDFLGQVHLDGSFIVRQRTMAKVVKPLQPRKKGEAVQGTIQLRVFCPPGIMDLCQKNTAYVTSKTLTRNDIPRCHVRLKILRADGLRKADCFATCAGDPYAVVFRDGHKLGRTPSCDSTTHPVWEEKNLFRLTDIPTKVVDKGHPDYFEPTSSSWFRRRRPKKEDVSDSDDDAAPAVAAGEADPETSRALKLQADKLAAESAGRGEPSVDVHIELFDDDAVSKDFLGFTRVTWKELMTPGVKKLKLKERPGYKGGKSQRYSARGVVVIKITHEVIVHARAYEASHLPQRDVFDVPDAYCLFKWGREVLGKSSTASNQLDPLWYGPEKPASFSVPLDPEEDEILFDFLHVEIWEEDLLSQDDFLGLVSVSRLDAAFPSPGVPHYLTRRPGMSEDPAPQGYAELNLRASYIPFGVAEPKKAQRIQYMPLVEHGGQQPPEAEVTVHILRAGNLLRTDLIGGADPFVIVRRNGKVIGQTKTKFDTLSPHWKDESFLVQVPLNHKGLPCERVELRLEVWDQDLFSKTLMGLVRLGADDLCTDAVIRRYALQPECPSQRFLRDPKNVNPKLGWLEVRCAVCGCLQLCVNQADEIRAADPSGTSDPYVKVKWAAVGCRTVGRCAPEKRTLNPRWNFTLNLSVPLTQPDSLFAAVLVEVWDHDFLGDDFLGLVAIDPAELVTAAETGGLVTRRLLDKDAHGRKKRQAHGTLSFKVEQSVAICNLRRRLCRRVMQAQTANRLDGCWVKFCVTKCTNLKNKKGFLNRKVNFMLPDPYVSVRLQKKRLGRTSTRPNTLNPVWTNKNDKETFTLKNVPTYAKETQGTSASEYVVTLNVFDDDVGRDRPMGSATMHWEELMCEGEHCLKMHGQRNDAYHKREMHFLKFHKSRMEKHVSRAVKGKSMKKKVEPETLEEHIVAGGALMFVRVWHVARVRLRVTGAHDIRPADWGVSGVLGGRADPYCVVKYQGKRVAKTKICNSTLDPCWNAVFEFTVPTHAPTEGEAADLLIEVFDHDLVGSDDFLGCAIIPHEHLLRPHPGDVYELGPAFNASVNGPVASGFLDVQVETSYIPGSMEPVAWPRAPLDGQKDPLDKARAAQEMERKIRKLNKEKARADLELWAGRDVRQARDKKSGRKYWWERLSKKERTKEDGTLRPVPRWWRDPRPPPIHPPSMFTPMDLPPRPSPTKRKYTLLNELEPQDLGFFVRPTAIVEVCVLRAGKLRNADLFGSSDPYATIRYGPQHCLKTIGRTSVVNNNCDPVWGQQSFRFPVRVDATCRDHQIVIELYDSDGTAGKIFGDGDDALGMAVFPVSEYLNSTGPLQRELRPQPGESPVTGFVEIRTQLLARVRLHLEGIQYGADEEGEADDGITGALTAGILGAGSSALALGSSALALAQDTAAAAQKNVALGALAIQDAAMDPSQLAALAQSGAQGALTTAQGGMNAAKSSLKNITKKKIKRKKVQVRSKWVGWQAHDLPVVRDKGALYVDVPITRIEGSLELHCEQVGSRRLLGMARMTTEDLLYGVTRDIPMNKVPNRKGKWLKGAHLRCRSEVPKDLAELIACVRGARTVAPSNNTLPRLSAIEIDIVRAQNLKQCDTFSLSDPFVVGYHGGEKIGTTSIINDTLSPIWPRDASSTFRLEKLRTCPDIWSENAGGFAEFDPIDYGVCLEVRDDDGPGRPTEFMGHCVLTLKDLLTPGEREFELLDPLDGDNGMGAEAFVCKHGRRSELPERKRRTPYKCFTEEVGRCGTIPGWGWGACLCVTCAPLWAGAAVGRGICFASQEAWHASWAAAYCVEDYCCTCCPCDLPRTQPVRGRLLVRIRHFAEVQLRILEGYSLQGVDEALLYGKASSDPYCVVEYRGKKVLKTKYRSKTLDPKWYESLTLEIEVPARGAVGSDGEAPALAGAPELPWEHPARALIRADESALKITVWDHDTFSGDDAMGQIIIRPEFLLRPQNGTHWPLMRVDDHTERAQGFIELDVRSSRVPGTLDPAPRRQFGSLGHYRELTDPVTGRNFWFDVWTRETFWVHPGEVLKRERETLARNKKSQLRIQELQAKRKKKSWFASKQESDLRGDSEALLHGLDRLTANSLEPQMVLGMILIRAHNLRNTDGGMLSGKSDPYATIRFGSEVIGRTATVKDCLDPEWFEGIRGVLPLGDEATEVVIEVWDDDGGGGRDDLLGEARLTSAQLYANADKVATLQLAAKPGQPAAQGSIEVHFECKLKCVFEINSLRTQEARDVYCSASWEGRECGECGRTPTTNPEDGLALWGHRFAIAIPVRWPLDVLVLTVREHRTEGEDALLGSVRVDASTLLPISFKEGEKPPEAPILRFPLSFSNDLSVPVKKRDLNRKGLVKRGKNFRRPSWEQAEIESKRKRPSSSRSFDEQLELERYAEEDDLGDPASPIANHLSRVTYDEVKEEPDEESYAEQSHMDESLAQSLRSFESEPEELFAAHSIFPSRKALWDGLFSTKPSAKDPQKPWGVVAKLLKWPVTQKKTFEKPPMLTKSFSKRTLARRSLELDRGHGDLLIVRCVAPPGTLQEYANFAHRNLQMPSANTLPKCTVEVEVSRADDLPQADLLGKSDPFVEIYCGGAKIGRTKTVWKTLNPKWDGEFFKLRNVPGIVRNVQDEMDGKLELRVMDDELVSTPDFLGYAQLEHKELLYKMPGQGWRNLDLVDDPAGVVGREKEEDNKVQSKVHLRGTLTIRTKLIVTVRVTIVGVIGLKRNDQAEDAVPDPFCKVKYLDKEWGTQTPERKDSLRPVWYHAVEVDVPVPDDGNFGSPLEVLVYDKGEKKRRFFSTKTVSNDELIGIASIDHEELIWPHDAPGLREVIDANGDATGAKVTLYIETSCIPGRIDKRRRPEVHAEYASETDARTGKVYWYDVCTRERFWDDPRPAQEALAAEIAEFERLHTGDTGNTQLPLPLLRAKRGFPEPPRQVSGAGGDASARIWWKPSRPNGPPVKGFSVERQRKRDGLDTWEDKGTVYVDAAAQRKADSRAAKAAGRALTKAELEAARSNQPPCALIVDELANDSWYRFRVYSHNDVGLSTPSNWSNDCRVQRPLPEGWKQVEPPDGSKTYYYNVKTRQTTWDRPDKDPFALPTEVFLQFTSDELTHLQDVFQDKDYDRSNAISLREFEAALPALGEVLSPTDLLWLFYQSDLDPSAELSYAAFARAIATLKRARIERAPFWRWMPAKFRDWKEFLRRPRVPRAMKKLVAQKEDEIHERIGAWTKVPHPEIKGSTYWVNPETGETSYDTPDAIKYFLPTALQEEAKQWVDDDELQEMETQFDAMDLDGSGAIDIGELKLLIRALTGETYSDAKLRGIMYEVDFDRSGEIDFDEFVLAMITLKKGKRGAFSRFGDLRDIERDENVEALQADGAHVKLEAAKKSKKRYPHGYYCVCGCRALHEGEIQYIKSQKKIYSIFPRLSAKQLKSQAMGGGKASQMAVQQRNTMQETRYQPANLVPDQPRMASREEVPKWSMLQVNYKREEVTGDASPPKVGRLRHQTEERNLKLLTD